MAKKSKQTSTTVQTPTNPSWVTDSIQGLSGQIGGLAGKDPLSFVANANPLQTQAVASAAKLGGNQAGYGQAQDYLSRALGTPAPQAAGVTLGPANTWSASSLLDNLSAYMNPYTNNVVDTTLAGFDKNAGQTRAQQALDMAGAGAFGGSGSALTRSMTEQNLAQQRASTEAGLRSDAFNVGAGLSNSDAARRQEAAAANAAALNQFALTQGSMSQNNNQFNAGLQNDALSRMLSGAGLAGSLASDQGASARADTALQGQIGNDMWNIDQAKAQSPLDLLKLQAGLTASLPYNLFNGQTTNSTSKTSTFDPVAILKAASMFIPTPKPGG